MQVTLILKNGYRFTGRLLEENENTITIDDRKLGKTTVDKASIAAKSEEEAGLNG